MDLAVISFVFLSELEKEFEGTVKKNGVFTPLISAPLLVMRSVGLDDSWLGSENGDDSWRDTS